MFTIKKIASRALFISAGVVFYTQSAWALLPIEHWSEPSGAQVWLVNSPGIPMVDMQVDFDAGERRSPPAQAGLANAVGSIAIKGVRAVGDAPALDENQLGEAWADLGASISMNADNDSFSVALRSLTEPHLLQKTVQLAARQLAEPAWPEDIWQRERERWSAAIRESNTRPGTLAGAAFAAAVYGSHPYGFQVTEKSLANIHIADMQQFYAQYIQPCRARIAIVGAVDRAQAQTLVTQLLARLPVTTPTQCAPLPAVAEVQPLTAAVEKNIPFASAQAYVLVGQPGIKYSDPDRLALLMGNHILGGGGFTSRLTDEVREKRGLTYGVTSHFTPGLHAGAFAIGLQTRPDQAAQALQVVRDTLKRYVADGPTPAELRAAKDYLIGSFALRIDSNSKLLGNVINIAENGLPLDYLDHWTDRVQALTVAQVRAAMRRTLQPDRMATIVLGAQP